MSFRFKWREGYCIGNQCKTWNYLVWRAFGSHSFEQQGRAERAVIFWLLRLGRYEHMLDEYRGMCRWCAGVPSEPRARIKHYFNCVEEIGGWELDNMLALRQSHD